MSASSILPQRRGARSPRPRSDWSQDSFRGLRPARYRRAEGSVRDAEAQGRTRKRADQQCARDDRHGGKTSRRTITRAYIHKSSPHVFRDPDRRAGHDRGGKDRSSTSAQTPVGICRRHAGLHHAKAAVHGMTRSFARDLGKHRIRVNTIVPGWVMTERQKTLWAKPEAIERHSPPVPARPDRTGLSRAVWRSSSLATIRDVHGQQLHGRSRLNLTTPRPSPRPK